MFIRSEYISIPARESAEETTLHVKIVAENKASLSTKPYTFMLPGGPGANHTHYKDYDCMRESANVIFYDPRGCGLSAKGSPEFYTMDNYIEDLHIVRQKLGLPKIQLVGKSYGAMCALGYALRYPDEVTHLVLAAGSPSFRNLNTAKIHVEKYANAEQKAVCKTLFAGTFENLEKMEDYFNVMENYYSFKIRNNHRSTRPQADYPFCYEALNLGFSDFLRHFDFEPSLNQIQCETLILAGEQDWITAKEHSIKMAECIPNATLFVFENSDHSLEEDVPELFFPKICDFLRVAPEKALEKAPKYGNFFALKPDRTDMPTVTLSTSNLS